eukprot:Nk52_evm58s223 gene=Nk52_evmTU58s223
MDVRGEFGIVAAILAVVLTVLLFLFTRLPTVRSMPLKGANDKFHWLPSFVFIFIVFIATNISSLFLIWIRKGANHYSNDSWVVILLQYLWILSPAYASFITYFCLKASPTRPSLGISLSGFGGLLIGWGVMWTTIIIGYLLVSLAEWNDYARPEFYPHMKSALGLQESMSTPYVITIYFFYGITGGIFYDGLPGEFNQSQGSLYWDSSIQLWLIFSFINEIGWTYCFFAQLSRYWGFTKAWLISSVCYHFYNGNFMFFSNYNLIPEGTGYGPVGFVGGFGPSTPFYYCVLLWTVYMFSSRFLLCYFYTKTKTIWTAVVMYAVTRELTSTILTQLVYDATNDGEYRSNTRWMTGTVNPLTISLFIICSAIVYYTTRRSVLQSPLFGDNIQGHLSSNSSTAIVTPTGDPHCSSMEEDKVFKV